jgi:protein TonB
MSNRTLVILSILAVLSVTGSVSAQSSLTAKNTNFQPQPANVAVESDRLRDGLIGPVRRVRTEIVKLVNQGGRSVEGKRVLLEVAAYDIKGNKTENQYFPVDGATLTGKEVYKYDDKGNISEMTLVNDDGSLLGKELYKYEFDFAGNWNKMTTSVALIDAGRVVFEPTEITYRSIMYYLDENMAKMMTTPTQPAPPPVVTKPANNSNGTSKVQPNVPKPGPDLPVSAVALDKVNLSNSTEAKTVSTAVESKAPQVVLDSEPPPTPRTILKPISGGVLNGSALSLPAPYYPDAAKRMRVAGVVIVEVVIDETGKVISAKATSGPATLREAAVQAALRARFSPTKLSGQPVKVSGVINYKFSLS